jgi:hypothetical protein
MSAHVYAFMAWTGTTLPCYLHTYIIYALHQILLGQTIFKQDQVVRACGMHGRDEKCIKVWSENLNRRDHLEDLKL